MTPNELQLEQMKKTRDSQITIRLTEDETDNLRALAGANASTVASTIRRAIQDLLAKEENQLKIQSHK